MDNTFTELEEAILQGIDGVGSNSFVQIIDADLEEDEFEQPNIISHSSYYDFDLLCTTLNSSKSKFIIFSTNIQSINAKIDQLRIFIESLQKIDYVFSALCIQESWLSEGDDVSQIQIEGYDCIPLGKSCSSKGGLIIYLHEHFSHDPNLKVKLNTYKTWEGLIIHVKKGETLAKPINIGNIYRPPKENLEHYYEFINEFSPILQKLEQNKYEAIFTDDFNTDLLKINDKHVINEYFDMLTSQSFYPKITFPTRLTNNNGTLIDIFFCKLTESTLVTTSGVLINKFSDHQPYLILLNYVSTQDPPPKIHQHL